MKCAHLTITMERMGHESGTFVGSIQTCGYRERPILGGAWFGRG
jgi:hypothetical protein